ncbi:hypothetical protein BDV96DRAFT_62714 [Lophiotrema nucula]|uniref:Uncharacterized protein n=1 Tax=Lophiotrema nucula TaxID=690887 RepID=A0A6A5Z7M5_9PLEO|nr:hypothetical protein BDV96DRAFT_62714 [Lophiotrema nucula]
MHTAQSGAATLQVWSTTNSISAPPSVISLVIFSFSFLLRFRTHPSCPSPSTPSQKTPTSQSSSPLSPPPSPVPVKVIIETSTGEIVGVSQWTVIEGEKPADGRQGTWPSEEEKEYCQCLYRACMEQRRRVIKDNELPIVSMLSMN